MGSSRTPAGAAGIEQDIEDAEQQQHGRNADQHPLEEADLHAELGADEPDPDHIGRRADRGGQASDRGGERGHQHERGRVAGVDRSRMWDPRMAARMDRPIPNIMAVVAVLEIHQEMSAVTAPKASRIRLGRAADPGKRQHGVGHPAVEPVNEDGARQDEGADEEEHQRVGERREHLLGRGDLEHDAGGRAQQRRDREGQRLGDPEDHDGGQNRRKPVGRRRESFQGKDEEEQEDCGGENGSDASLHATTLLRRRFRASGDGDAPLSPA